MMLFHTYCRLVADKFEEAYKEKRDEECIRLLKQLIETSAEVLAKLESAGSENANR